MTFLSKKRFLKSVKSEIGQKSKDVIVLDFIYFMVWYQLGHGYNFVLNNSTNLKYTKNLFDQKELVNLGYREFKNGSISLAIDKKFLNASLANVRKLKSYCSKASFSNLIQAFTTDLAKILKEPRGLSNIDSRLNDQLVIDSQVNINRLGAEITQMCGFSVVVKCGSNDKISPDVAFRFNANSYFQAQKILSHLEKQVFGIVQPLALIRHQNNRYWIMPEIEGELVSKNHKLPPRFLQVFKISDLDKDFDIFYVDKPYQQLEIFKEMMDQRGLNLGSDCFEHNLIIDKSGKLILIDLIP